MLKIPKIPYFYIIQHLPTGKYYAGCKFSEDANPETFMKEFGYTTSSKTINKLIKETGIDSFIIINLLIDSQCDCDVLTYETSFLREIDAKNNILWFNKHNNQKITYGSQEFESKMKEKYGVSHNSYLKSTIEKRKITFKNKSSLEKEEKTNKTKATCLRKYGVDNVSKVPELIEKFRTTTHFKSDGFREQSKESCMERYGVEYVSQCNSVKLKKEKTFQERYGASTFLQSKAGKENTSQIFFEKYGIYTSNPSLIPEITKMKLEKQENKRKRPKSIAIENFLYKNNITAREIGISSHYLRSKDSDLEKYYNYIKSLNKKFKFNLD